MLNSASTNRTKQVRFSNPRNMSKGKIISFTKVWSASSDFEGRVPYYLALIELEDKTRTMGQIVDSSEITNGSLVESCIRKINADGKRGILEYGTKFRVIK